MADGDVTSSANFRAAFLANEQQVRINTGKVACVLVIALMPARGRARFFVYPDIMVEFLGLRLLCSLLAVGLLDPAHDRHRPQTLSDFGLPIVLFPPFFIAWMVHVSTARFPPITPGLNLILLAVSAVVHWSMLETLLAVRRCLSCTSPQVSAGTTFQLELGHHFQQSLFPRADGHHRRHRQLFLQPPALSRIRPALRIGQKPPRPRGQQPEAHGTGPDQEPLLRQHQP